MWLASHPGGMGSANACVKKPNAATTIAAALQWKYFRNNFVQNPPGSTRLVGSITVGH
jgi:hypothetical protein